MKNDKLFQHKNLTIDLSEELIPDYTVHTKSKHIVVLSKEDMEALRLGREFLKRKAGGDLHEINQEYHKHLSAETNTYEKKSNIRRFFKKFFR